MNILKNKVFAFIFFSFFCSINLLANTKLKAETKEEYSKDKLLKEDFQLLDTATKLISTMQVENHIKEAIFDVFNISLASRKLNLQSFELGDKNLKILMPIIVKMDNDKTINWLVLSDNNLTTLPEEFKNLKNIEILDLWKNNLQTFPLNRNDLPNLTKLYLERNPITEAEVNRLKMTFGYIVQFGAQSRENKNDKLKTNSEKIGKD